MKRFLRSKLVLSLATLIMLTGAILIPLLRSHASVAHAASATVTDIPNPDNYTCAQSGYITFETMSDGTNLSPSAINGVQFTTTNGYTWLVGDFATGNYNGKYPNGGYTSQGTHWAWLGPNQGAGRIDFVNGPASVFSLLVSDYTPVQLDAYNAAGTLLVTAGPGPSNYNTGHMSELKITRDTADIAYVIAHDTGNYFLVDSICTNASGVPNQALNDFKQNRNADGSPVRWAGDHLFDIPTCPTMEAAGCAITSLADVLASYGLQTLPDGTSVDPGHLNHYLGQNPGTHSGCLIYFDTAGRAVNYNVLHNDFSWIPLATRIQHIDDAIKAGNLVIAGIGGHYVVFYQKASPAPDGSPDYFIADPYRYQPYASGDRSGKTLYQAYHETINQLKNVLQVVVVENKAPQPGRSWVIVAHSPVQLLITDPTGAQTGFNPATGSNLQDIVGSSYGVQQGLIDDTGVLPPLPDVLYFGQNNLEDGTYKVQVIGTGSGPYTLDFAVASGPSNTSLQTVTGTAVPGQTDTYIVSTSGGQPISIQRQVQIDIKPGEDPPAINPGSKGVTPVAILSTPTFDATTVDPNSVKFGPTGASPVHTSIEDVNGDGIPDLMFQFNTAQTGIAAGNTQACLTGKTTSGLNIVGCDTIQTVPPGS